MIFCFVGRSITFHTPPLHLLQLSHGEDDPLMTSNDVMLAAKQYDLVLNASKHGVKHSAVPGENDGSRLVNAEF